MTDRKIRLVYLLTGLVFIAMLGTFIALASAAFIAEKNSLNDMTLKLNHEAAEKRSTVMNTTFLMMKQSLQANAASLTGNESAETIQKQLDFFMSGSNCYNSVFVADRNANIKSVSPASLRTTSPKLTSPMALKALEARTPTLSESFISSANRLVILMTHPIFDGQGEYAGYLGATIYLQDRNILNDLFGANAQGEFGYSYVVDKSGQLIYHPDKSRLGEDVKANSVVQKLLQGRNGYEKVRNTKGDLYMAGYAVSAESGWGIVVQTADTKIRAETRKLLYTQIAYSLPLFLVLLLVTFYLAKQLSSPFTSLTEAARNLLSGKAVPELPDRTHWNYEAHHLNETILLSINALQKQAKELSNEAKTDPLTGLSNRRSLDARLTKWVQEGRAFSVIILDIDNFKYVNDTYGHPAGDEVLKFLARKMQLAVRKEDQCYRYGGEEFVVLLPYTPLKAAFKTAERIRQTVEKECCPIGSPITISLGAAAYPDHACSALEVLQAADQAMYAAKRNGRNRTESFSPDMP